MLWIEEGPNNGRVVSPADSVAGARRESEAV
jgi:hypothetical protein